MKSGNHENGIRLTESMVSVEAWARGLIKLGYEE